MPEFIAPEVANGEGVNYSADLWSLGIITYILLSGVSPFKGLNDRETLTRIKEGKQNYVRRINYEDDRVKKIYFFFNTLRNLIGKWEFDEDHFRGISLEARDFISKLLVYKGEERMDVKTALRHPWFERIDKTSLDQLRIETTNLRNYHSSLRQRTIINTKLYS